MFTSVTLWSRIWVHLLTLLPWMPGKQSNFEQYQLPPAFQVGSTTPWNTSSKLLNCPLSPYHLSVTRIERSRATLLLFNQKVPPSSVAYVRLSTHLRAIPTPLSLICLKWRKLGKNFKLVVLRLQYVKTSRQNAGMNEVKTLISASLFLQIDFQQRKPTRPLITMFSLIIILLMFQLSPKFCKVRLKLASIVKTLCL